MKNIDEFSWCLESGLRVDYLGEWYRFDKRFGFMWNLTRRLVELNSMVFYFLKNAKIDHTKKIGAEILLEHEHLGGFFHNKVSHIYTDAGLNHSRVDLDKINMDYIVKKYGVLLK